MRIVHVSDCYAPRSGGIEIQVRDLARGQVAAGHEVHVLTATIERDRSPGSAGEDGVQVHRLGLRLARDVPVNPGAARRMRALFRQLDPDVVHVHAGVVSPFAFDGARVALRAGVPLAITWHCMLDGILPMLRAGVRLSRWRNAPVALSAVSRVAGERVERVFGRPVSVVPNGIDLQRWVAAVRSDPAAEGPLRCVATMRLAPRKRGPALIDIISVATRQLGPGGIAVQIIGGGPAQPIMRRRLRRRGLGDVVRMRGRLERGRLLEEYERADVFIAPASLEAFGIAALEARTAGLVVVGRRGTGLEEYVTDGVDGLLVDDDAGVARALGELAQDRELLGSLSRHARKHLPKQGWAATQEAAMAEYQRAQALR